MSSDGHLNQNSDIEQREKSDVRALCRVPLTESDWVILASGPQARRQDGN